MVGDDGRRGWVYDLAVRHDHRKRGLGRTLVTAGEQWLRERGVVKVQLMVRGENTSVLSFYEATGYERNGVQVLSRWMKDESRVVTTING